MVFSYMDIILISHGTIFLFGNPSPKVSRKMEKARPKSYFTSMVVIVKTYFIQTSYHLTISKREVGPGLVFVLSVALMKILYNIFFFIALFGRMYFLS